MVQRSDDKGDKRSPGKSSETSASRDAESNAANVLRERIRQAGAATARASDHAPPNSLLVPNSSAPPMAPAAETSGVRTRPPEPRQTSITPPLFGPPRLTPAAMTVPWPAGTRRREHAATRVGMGPPDPAKSGQSPPADPLASTTPAGGAPVAQSPPTGLGWRTAIAPPADPDSEDLATRTTDKISLPVPTTESGPAPRGSHPTPRGIAPPSPDTWALSNARTQPMPRVRAPGTRPNAPEVEELRRAELATTRKTQGLLRAPEPSSPQVGRYSVHDVSTEYVDTGIPPAPASEDTTPAIDPAIEDIPGPHDAIVYDSEPPRAEEQPEADTRPRRSTPKQRVGHRRSSRPEVGHARDRGTKRTDPGIRARTLRGNVPASPLPAAKTQPSPLPAARPSSSRPSSPLPPDTSSVVVDPSLTQPLSPPPSPTQKREVSSYVPLPRDREAYEAFLRSAAGEHGGAPRARPVWAQQETALIPRDMLEPPPEYEVERGLWRVPWFKSAIGLLMIAVGGAVLWWVLQSDVPSSPRVTEVAPSAPLPAQAVRAITLIATEPTGAELLLDGAVIGNTPLEVSRPASGEVLYLVRLRSFEHQMVRITSATHEAIHITLVPSAGETPAPAPAKSR